MKQILLSLCLLLCGICGYTQNYDVLTYNINGTPVNGIKIKTNLPFTNGSQMPTIIFEGYNMGTAEPVGLILTYYIYNNAFYNPKVSSFGSYTPPLYLASEGGKVIIFLDSRVYYQRFSIRAFAKGIVGDVATNYQGWTVADEKIFDTTSIKQLIPYQNRLSGTVYLPANGIWTTNGNVGIGTITPQAKLAVNGDVFAKKVKVTQTGWPDYVFEQDYPLPPLPELEKYLAEHKHLPGVPPALEIEKDGLDIGEMNKKMMQKIEELTLYIIDLKKEIDQLKAERH